jgi:hypothetical protein
MPSRHLLRCELQENPETQRIAYISNDKLSLNVGQQNSSSFLYEAVNVGKRAMASWRVEADRNQRIYVRSVARDNTKSMIIFASLL